MCNHCGADQDDQAANPLAQYMPAPCLCCHKYVAGGWTATRCNHCGAMTGSALAERVALLSSRFMVALDYTSTSTRRSILGELDALLTTLKGYRGRMAAEQAAQTQEAVAALHDLADQIDAALAQPTVRVNNPLVQAILDERAAALSRHGRQERVSFDEWLAAVAPGF